MVERVIVGWDGSDGSRAALAWAVAEARLHAADVTALVIEDGAGDDPGIRFEELADRARREAGYEIEVRRDRGPPADRIVAACAPQDLLVVGRRGRNVVASLLLGSVSRACVTRAPCPVAVVHRLGPDPPHGRILVGVDGSPAARRAVRVAADEALRRGAVLEAAHVVGTENVDAQLVGPALARLTVAGQRLLAQDLAEAAGATARPIVLYGHPPELLVSRSGEADLLVVGRRGRSPVTGLLLGSTSDFCIRHAHCPVLAVR